jgi:hypothetical protein
VPCKVRALSPHDTERGFIAPFFVKSVGRNRNCWCVIHASGREKEGKLLERCALRLQNKDTAEKPTTRPSVKVLILCPLSCSTYTSSVLIQSSVVTTLVIDGISQKRHHATLNEHRWSVCTAWKWTQNENLYRRACRGFLSGIFILQSKCAPFQKFSFFLSSWRMNYTPTIPISTDRFNKKRRNKSTFCIMRRQCANLTRHPVFFLPMKSFFVVFWFLLLVVCFQIVTTTILHTVTTVNTHILHDTTITC